jgi:hypothetical protein
MRVCGGGGGPLPPPQEGASNLQPVLHHAGVVPAQNWSTGDHLCGGDANALAEELEPSLCCSQRSSSRAGGGGVRPVAIAVQRISLSPRFHRAWPVGAAKDAGSENGCIRQVAQHARAQVP